MIIDELRQKFPEMPNLRVRDIRVDKQVKKVFCVVSYPEMPILDKPLKDAIRSTVVSCIPAGYRYDIQLVNDKFNQTSFRALILDIIKKKYPLFSNVKSDKISVTIDGFEIETVFNVSESTKRSMVVSEFLEQLSDYFVHFTCYNVHFSLTVDKSAALQKSDIEAQEKLVQLAINRELLKPQRHFNVTDVEKHIGKQIAANPMYISDVRSPMDSCVVCGRISEKEIRATKNNPTLKLCKFNLTDDSGSSIPCIMFARFEIDDVETLKQTCNGKGETEILTISRKKRLANDKKMKMLMFLSNGLEVLVRGKVVLNDFSERLEMQLYDINKCRIQPINLQPKFERAIPDNYTLVQPTPIEEYRQLALGMFEEKKSILSGKDLVVLSANVTGYNVTKDKVFGICGIRVKNGHLREKFFTLVMPETTLADSQMKAANVNARQLMACPTLTELISDIVRFVGNSTLVGTNLSQLLELLNYYGAPFGYCLKNKTVAQTELLSTLFDHSVYDSKPNCSELEDVAKTLKTPVRISGNCQDVATAVATFISVLAERCK